MVWNITKDDIRVRMAVVEEHTWAPPLASEPKLPQKGDTKKYGDEMGVPLDKMGYSDFIKEGRLGEVDEVLRETYEEASKALGREFPYPKK
jgi:ribonuclease Z